MSSRCERRWSRARAPWLALGAVVLGACGGPAEPWFEEVAWRQGLTYEHIAAYETRWQRPEIVGGGVGLIDVENDGWFDVYLVQGGDLELPGQQQGRGNRLFRNLGGERFENVTRRAGVGHQGYGMGCAVGDVDADGLDDLYVTNVGPNVLYRNRGDGTFRDIAPSVGAAHPGWGTGASFCDFDADGDLDLFLVNHMDWSPALERECLAPDGRRDFCAAGEYAAGASDVLLRNDGAGVFTDVSREAGLAELAGNGLGCVTGDLDEDGDVDLYVANDGGPNRLWLQEQPGVFRDAALALGCAFSGDGSAESSRGVSVADPDGSGGWDLFVTSGRGETDTLYARTGSGWSDATARLGLGSASLDSSSAGAAFADFDHDGELDLYVGAGRFARAEPFPWPKDVYAEPDRLMRGLSGGRFEPARPATGLPSSVPGAARGVALGDLDNDGDLDLIVVQRGGRAVLLRNRCDALRSWIRFRVLSQDGRLARGARVEVVAEGRTRARRVDPGHGYLASHDPRVHFGLGAARVLEDVRVTWPGGAREHFGALAPGAEHVLQRGQGRASP